MKYFKYLVVMCLFPTVQARDGLIMDLLHVQNFQLEGREISCVCDHTGVSYDLI